MPKLLRTLSIDELVFLVWCVIFGPLPFTSSDFCIPLLFMILKRHPCRPHTLVVSNIVYLFTCIYTESVLQISENEALIRWENLFSVLYLCNQWLHPCGGEPYPVMKGTNPGGNVTLHARQKGGGRVVRSNPPPKFGPSQIRSKHAHPTRHLW